ncbi:MAG: hypothetical protein ABJA11_09260 [Pseudolysinimonas sp.]
MTRRPTRRALARVSVVVVAVVALSALTACVPFGTTPHPSPSPTGFAVPNAVAPLAPLVVPAVLASCPLEGPTHYDGYWIPVDEVYICRADTHHDTDGVSTYGPWETSYRIPHPEALLRAYRAPNARVIDPRLCPQAFADPLLVWVHHNGVTAAYYAPVDGCGDPSVAARNAYFTTTRITLVTVDRGAPDPGKKDTQG